MGASKAKTWWLYFLECADGSLYTGISNDLAKRLAQHQDGKYGAKYTRTRRPVVLVYLEQCQSRSHALTCEYQYKQYPRTRKLLLARVYLARSQAYASALQLNCQAPT